MLLMAAFFRTQILRHGEFSLQSEGNRLRDIPMPAARGVIYDRNGKPIADNAVGYSVVTLARSEDSLRALLDRLRPIIGLTDREAVEALKRYQRDRSRPVVILRDASYDVVSVLEEHRLDLPGLIVQLSPKRVYAAGKAVGALTGYVAEIDAAELSAQKDKAEDYRAGQLTGKQGLEQQYEAQLRGREGTRFVEVDARNRVVRSAGARPDIPAVAGQPLYTSIDLDLQTYIHSLFGDTLSGGVVAMDPRSGGMLAIYSSPAVDPNRFIGGVSLSYYDSLRSDPRRPLFNKALQGTYPPGSIWKLATAVIALQESLVTFADHMPRPDPGYFVYGDRVWRDWKPGGHGNPDLSTAIVVSCDVYFYQLGLKIGLPRLIDGGLQLGFGNKSGIDLPGESRPRFPDRYPDYFNRKFGRNWTDGPITLNMSIGQGENAQTLLNMVRFYGALANNGIEFTPRVARRGAARRRLFQLPPEQETQLRAALVGVVASGTATGAAVSGLTVAGKTGTAQTGIFVDGVELNHAWFVGFAPANNPRVVVAVMLENVRFHGSVAAGMATKIMSRSLRVQVTSAVRTEAR